MDIPEIKKALADRAEDVCRYLLPDGKIEGKEWVGGHLKNGEGGHSLRVVLDGPKAGIFKDFGGNEGGSNLLELWVQARGVAFKTALDQVKEYLGKAGLKFENDDLRKLRKKEYAKPVKKGITHILDRVQMYLTAKRSIPLDVLKRYKIAMLDTGDTIVFPYLSDLAPHDSVMIKYVKLDRDERGKKVSWTSKDTAKVLFGMHTRRPEDRYLMICEGEIDAMSWDSLGIHGLCCTSVPFGAKWESDKTGIDPNSEWIENNWDFVQSFEKICLSGDMDEEGRKMVASLVKRLGREICYIVKLPTKDANEMLVAGRNDELRAAYEAARTLDPDNLKNASHYREEVLDRMYNGDMSAKRGIPLPYGAHPIHIRWNEMTVVTGQNGSGKTTLLNHILLYLLKLGHASCVASLEVQVSQTLAFNVRQVTGAKVPDRKEAERALDFLATGLWFYDHVGEAKWQDVISAFRYAYRRYGCRIFVIDSWMKMGIAGDDLEKQGEVCNAITDFTKECDVHVFVVAHPRKLKDEKEVVGKMDVKGSGELTDQAHNVFVVWRNKAKEMDIERMEKMRDEASKILNVRKSKPDAQLFVVKQRNDDGAEPTLDLYYHGESKCYSGYFIGHGVSMLDAPIAPTTQPVVSAAPSTQLGEDTPF